MRIVGTKNEGRLEVYYNNQWGTVCDDEFDGNDAMVACRQLGFNGSASVISSSNIDDGIGLIVLDNLLCTGVEERLVECEHRGLGVENCDHSEDIGISCSIQNEPSKDISLYSYLFS